MSAIEMFPVRTRREKRLFLAFPWKIYAGDPLWVPPLIPEREKAIDPGRGAFFKRGTAELFMAWMDGKPAGTICAAEDKTLNARLGKRECIFGFFECVNDYAVAKAMLDHVREWASARGLTTLAGPFNLDYEDSYGVLVEGRDRPPVILCGHSPPYYQGFFEDYGFTPLRGDNIAFEFSFKGTSPALERTSILAERIRRKGLFTIRTPDMRHWEREVDVVQSLLNQSTAHLTDYRPYEREAVEILLVPFRTMTDPDLVLFVQAKGKPVGWFPGIANVNEILIHANGFRYPWDRLRVLAYRRKRFDCLSIKSVLILPEYWGSGAAVLLFDEMAKRARAKGYRWADLSLTSEDNPYTPGLAKHMGARVYKRYRLYRLDLNGNSPHTEDQGGQ